MVTKAIVADVSDKYNIKVRIPIYNRASFANQKTVDADLPAATSCVLPNSSLNLRVGDIVYVSFEDDDTGRPVILGCLYMESGNGSTCGSIFADSINVKANAVLPSETSIGKVTSKELGFLTGMRENTQYQIDELTKKVNTSGGDIEDLTERVDSLEEDVGTLQDNVSTAQEDISTLQGDVSDLYDGLGDIPVIKSTGTDSAVQKTTDPSRTNVASGSYSFSFGSRNNLESTASESGAFGGIVTVTAQDTFGFGYRVFAHGNQSIVGGYHSGSNAPESLIFGNNVVVDCTAQPVPGDSDPDHYPLIPNSTASQNKSKYLMVFGKNNSVASDCQADLIYGKNNSIPQYVYNSTIGGDSITVNGSLSNSFIFGEKHKVGLNGTNWVNSFGYENCIGLVNPFVTSASYSYAGGNEDINVFGYQNNIGRYLKDSTVIGYWNKVAGGTGSNNMKESVYILGHDNSANSGSTNSPSAVENVYMYGRGLLAKKDMVVLVGSYNGNGHRDGAYFEVGTGSSSSRRTSFSVCYNDANGHHIYIGDEILTRNQLIALKSLLNTSSGNSGGSGGGSNTPMPV